MPLIRFTFLELYKPGPDLRASRACWIIVRGKENAIGDKILVVLPMDVNQKQYMRSPTDHKKMSPSLLCSLWGLIKCYYPLPPSSHSKFKILGQFQLQNIERDSTDKARQ